MVKAPAWRPGRQVGVPRDFRRPRRPRPCHAPAWRQRGRGVEGRVHVVASVAEARRSGLKHWREATRLLTPKHSAARRDHRPLQPTPDPPRTPRRGTPTPAPPTDHRPRPTRTPRHRRRDRPGGILRRIPNTQPEPHGRDFGTTSRQPGTTDPCESSSAGWRCPRDAADGPRRGRRQHSWWRVYSCAIAASTLMRADRIAGRMAATTPTSAASAT